ncbi:MAG TPA: outer membrane beta-barrel protein [Candidatus Sulfotelmatobacter sp.]|nr:outer membrane beta-barrel protein [Candidatus Sulfotelmatobacter sp.]
MRATIGLRSMLVPAGLLLVSALAPALASAQNMYQHKGTFVLGGGMNAPVGEINPYLNSSGSFYFGGGRNLNRRFALQVEYTHNWLAVDDAVIQRAADETQDSTQIQNAHASLWSVTLNGVLRFREDTDVVPWITAGGGYYKRNLILTANALVYYPPIWDPWWGWIDGGWGPGQAVVGQRASSGFGFNVGGGIDFEIENGASLFLEARYHMAFMDAVNMQIVPVMAGIRW